MKTQILQLEAHDDVISTRDKLGWGQTGRVVLVWPKRGRAGNGARLLTRRLDLVMLQRHSAALGLQIALVTQDGEVRSHARQLRIPVFKTVEEAQRTHWRGRRRREFPRPTAEEQQKHSALLAPKINAPRLTRLHSKELHPAVRWSLFGLAMLSLLALAAAVLPQAQITLRPETDSQEVTINLLASPAHTEASLTGEMPARLTPIIVEGRGSLPVTGEVWVPEKAATTRVRFTNLTAEPVAIPQGLVISNLPRAGSAPVRFSTTQAGQVPAGAGKFISLPVRAISPGRVGNLPANSLVAIEGPSGLELSVANLLPAAGGTDLPAPGPALSDYSRLYSDLYETLLANAMNELERTLGAGDLVITPTLVLAETLEETYDPAHPQEASAASVFPRPAAQLDLFLRLRFEVLVVPGADLSAVAGRILDASLPDGFAPLPGSLEIIPAGRPLVETVQNPAGRDEVQPVDLVRWRVRARRAIQAQIDVDQVIGQARGLTAGQAADALQERLPLQERPVISTNPAWWPRLPLLPLRISVTIAERPFQPE